MRYGFGLLALLVVVAIILIVQANVTIPTVQKGMEAREQASQIAGVDETGGRVMDTYDLKEVMDGGKLRGLRVTRIKAGSPMQTYYGLQKDDLIVEYGAAGSMMPVRQESDADLVKAMIAEAYQRHQPITVVRNGQQLKLDGEAMRKAGINPTAPPAPSAPPSPSAGQDSIQGQLDKIKTPR